MEYLWTAASTELRADHYGDILVPSCLFIEAHAGPPEAWHGRQKTILYHCLI